MNSSDVATLLRTNPDKYVIKDYVVKHSSSPCWMKFGLPAEIVNEKTNEFKIIDGFASCKDCFTTFVFRPGSKGTGTTNLNSHKCLKMNDDQPALTEVCPYILLSM